MYETAAAPISRAEISTAPGSYWVRPSEAAFLLGCSAGYLTKLVREGRVESRKLSPKMRLISRESIERIGAAQPDKAVKRSETP